MLDKLDNLFGSLDKMEVGQQQRFLINIALKLTEIGNNNVMKPKEVVKYYRDVAKLIGRKVKE